MSAAPFHHNLYPVKSPPSHPRFTATEPAAGIVLLLFLIRAHVSPSALHLTGLHSSLSLLTTSQSGNSGRARQAAHLRSLWHPLGGKGGRPASWGATPLPGPSSLSARCPVLRSLAASARWSHKGTVSCMELSFLWNEFSKTQEDAANTL